MLSKLEFTLEKLEADIDVNCSSLFQGVLMDVIDSQYAEELHGGGLNPYSQYLKFSHESIIWSITGLNSDAYKNILLPMSERLCDTITIEHKKAVLKIREKNMETFTYEELMQDTFFGDCSPWITMKFIAPTAFKVNGAYQFYPTAKHIFGSLMRKYDQASSDSQMFSEEVLEQIEDNVRVVKYNLRSTQFHMEGVKIPGFMGFITFKANGPKQFINLLNMLVKFGEYSGVGIKTSMGMGAIEKQ